MPSLTRRGFLHGLAAASAAGTLAGCASMQRKTAQKRPNIILIVGDDHRYDALGCMGNPIIQTPHLDALAAAGTLFRNNFCTTAICCSSRASILTGMYTRRHGITEFNQDFSPEKMGETYPALLRQAGYRTGFVGKFGVGLHPPEDSFDFWGGTPGQGEYFHSVDGKTVHATDYFSLQALAFLDTCSSEQPFCLSISFNAPHAVDYAERPFPPASRFESLYKDAPIPPVPAACPRFYDGSPPFIQHSEGRKRWENNFGTPERYQQNAKDYYRLITGIDHAVGTLRAALSERGWDDNTVIIYTGDNGYFLGDRGLEGKWYLYEASTRTPLIIFDPRLGYARPQRAMTLNIDLAPTLLEMAGTPIPASMQGCSMLPLLHGRAHGWRGDWFYEHHFKHPGIPRSEGVRTNRWAYIRWIDSNPLLEELFDLKEDPLEGRNLAGDPGHSDVLDDMRAHWQRHAQNAV